MSFEPYSLMDFDRGLYKAKEPWISPEKSFRILENVRLENGRLVKRKGTSYFGALYTEVSSESMGDGGAQDIGYFDHTPLIKCAKLFKPNDTYGIEITDGTRTAKAYDDPMIDGIAIVMITVTDTITGGPKQYTGSIRAINNLHNPITFTDSTPVTPQTCEVQYQYGAYYGSEALVQSITRDVDSGGTNTWTPPAVYNPVYIDVKGDYDVTFASSTVGTVSVTYDLPFGVISYYNGYYLFNYAPVNWDNPVTADYQYVTDDPIMIIKNLFTLDGAEYLLAANTDKVYRYNATTERYADPLGSFSGVDNDFMHCCPYENIVVINNRTDPPQKYTPVTPAIAEMGTDFDADSSNNIQAAWFCFRHKHRLVYLRTTENSTDYAQRARWTPVNDIEYSAGTGDEAEYYTDAPTTDKIVGAELLGDELIVTFDRSVWKLAYASEDPFSAFVWIRLSAVEGSASPMAQVSLGDALLFRGRDGIKITDGLSIVAADLEFPDEVLSWNLNAEEYSYGAYVKSEEEALITFADAGDTYPDHILTAHLNRDRRIKGFSTHTLSAHCFGHYRRSSIQSWDEATAGLTPDEITWALDDLARSVGFPITLLGTRNGYIYEYASGYSDATPDKIHADTEVDVKIETIRINPYPFRKCHLGSIQLIADALAGSTVTVYVTSDYDASPHSSYTVDLTPTGNESKVCRQIQVNRIAVFHTIRIEHSSKTPFALDDITLNCKAAGQLREIA